MRARLAVLALAGACAMAASAARADVIYTYDGISPVSAGSGPITVSINLDIANAAVESGSFQISGSVEEPLVYSPAPPYPLPVVSTKGDTADFIGFRGSASGGGITASQTNTVGFGTFDATLTFNASGDITSDTVDFVADNGGTGTEAHISGDQALTTGGTYSDYDSLFGAAPCNTPVTSPTTGASLECPVSGSWTHTAFTPGTAVPEPATFAVLGAGLVWLAAARRRGA